MWTDRTIRSWEEWKELILELSEDEDFGYIFECDLEYHKELHNTHKDLPLAPEQCHNRLCTTIFYKKDYVFHSRNIKHYLEKGINMTHLSKIISFKQKDYMKGRCV